MISTLAKGTSEIGGFSSAVDPRSTRKCLEALGMRCEEAGSTLKVHGVGLHGMKQASGLLDAGNSGTTMRLLAGILAGQHFDSKISGDESLNRRPMRRIIDPLSAMGAAITGSSEGTAPLTIRAVPTLHPIRYTLPVASAQVKSALLFAGLYADGVSHIAERVQTRDHTERMLGLKTRREKDLTITSIEGGMQIEAKRFFIPGDFSSAIFLIVAALLTPNSSLVVKKVCLNSTRTAGLEILKRMGGKIEVLDERVIEGEAVGDIQAHTSDLKSDLTLSGPIIPALVDEIPILAVAALFAEGRFTVREAQDLRNKESDRIRGMVQNIKALGGDVEEYSDGFAFEGKKNLIGTGLASLSDHRIAMAFGVAGLVIPGIMVRNAECVDISFPGFWNIILGSPTA